MKKKELVYRELLLTVLGRERKGSRGEERITQLGLARALGVSLSTVNNALKPLAAMGVVRIRQRGLSVLDKEKLLLYWASVRNLEKDVVYRTRAETPVSSIEKSMPAGVIFTAYSGYKFRYGDVPADYGEVYCYADEREAKEIEKRFPERESRAPNIIVLKKDSRLALVSENNVAPAPQLFADLWNLREWYAKDFLEALKKRLM